MADDTTAMGYSPGPTASVSPPPAASARYAYLVSRLRNRQITMEEATELFGVMQASLARVSAAPTGRVATPPLPPPPVPAHARGPEQPILTDETLAVSLVALGAGAGLLAAILKRSAEGPRTTGRP